MSNSAISTPLLLKGNIQYFIAHALSPTVTKVSKPVL